MKKTLLAVMLCIISIAANAQRIYNNGPCDVVIIPVCYDPTTCAFAACGAGVVVAAGNNVPLPTCACTLIQGYEICYSACGNSCATIGMCGMSAYPCGNFGTSATLLSCGSCPGVHIFCDTAGDLIVQ